MLNICYTEAIGVQEDQYPTHIADKVNQSLLSRTRLQPVEQAWSGALAGPVEPSTSPPGYIHLSIASDRATVTWGDFGKRYLVVTYLVPGFTSADLFGQLKLCSVESAERCSVRIRDKLRFHPEIEIATPGGLVGVAIHLSSAEDEAGRAVSGADLRPPAVLRRSLLPADEREEAHMDLSRLRQARPLRAAHHRRVAVRDSEGDA